MKNKTIKIIFAKDEVELVEKINLDPQDFFATQIKQKSDGSWVCFCYFNNFSVTKDEPKKEKSSVMATDKQKSYMYKNNLDVNTEKLTKAEAFQIIKAHKEKPKEEKIKEEDLL